ncbi:MAG: hypothetical protein IPK25_16465 [Saprospiraceae bacterium]|nr:hypothetical protein [Saprospiraceae bacterium]
MKTLILNTFQRTPELYEWFENEWVHLVVVHPETKKLSRFTEGVFVEYSPLYRPEFKENLESLFETEKDNLSCPSTKRISYGTNIGNFNHLSILCFFYQFIFAKK